MNRTFSGGVSTALAMMALLSCSDLPTEPNALELDDPLADPVGLIASIEVTLASSSLSPGQTTQATAILLNQYGNTVDRPVTWSSGDSAIATVSGSGLVTAIAPGTATITASRRSVSGSATLTVTGGGTSITAPGTVSDLSVSAIQSNSVTLSFTQVDDGTGKPASYDVRYAVAPISWGDAPEATSGTCTTPVAGTVIGSRLTCTVLGLSPSTNYNFQLVSFRGTLNMNAVFGGLSNIASATTTAEAPPPPATAPGTVSDLSVSAIQSNSVTLSFTQVDDGTGQPAKYDVRYAVAPISWGSAPSATSGTCTTPVAGTAIGSRLTCNVSGLSSSTNYNFQLVSFRGTLNMNAVFGGLSNVVSAATVSGSAAPVASVTVGLVNASLTVGETTQATATTRDANGNVLTGRVINWSSSNSAVASVSAFGLVTALAAGTAVITASCEGASSGATISVQAPPVPASGGPNEPTGMTVITERPFTALREDGWYDQDTPDLTIEQDASAPRSPSSIIQQHFAAGFVGGGSAAVSEKGLGRKYTTIYISYWIKYSLNWYGHPTSGVNKQMHVWINGGNHVFTLAFGSGTGPLKAEIWLQGTEGPPSERNLYANLGNPGTITRGKWHHWEMVFKCNTNGAANGSVEWWIDGAKIGQYYDVRLEPITSYWEAIQWSPTWGGTGSTTPGDQFEWLDHIYISGKN